MKILAAVLTALRYETTKGFGRQNALYMIIAALVVLVLVDDVPGLLYNGFLIVSGHGKEAMHLDRPPFWQSAGVFFLGLFTCMIGTTRDYARFEKNGKKGAQLRRSRKTGRLE